MPSSQYPYFTRASSTVSPDTIDGDLDCRRIGRKFRSATVSICCPSTSPWGGFVQPMYYGEEGIDPAGAFTLTTYKEKVHYFQDYWTSTVPQDAPTTTAYYDSSIKEFTQKSPDSVYFELYSCQ